jgi:regulator of nucleoside diphosphate kinase
MSARPDIVISSLDADRLERLLETVSAAAFPGKAELERELVRARVVDPKLLPANVVTMNSTVRFKVDEGNEEFTLKLVYPQDMNTDGGRISILAPVGSALLGLAVGEEIEWPLPGRGLVRVRIEAVTQPV